MLARRQHERGEGEDTATQGDGVAEHPRSGKQDEPGAQTSAAAPMLNHSRPSAGQ
jgi:hypothetical protein